MKYKCGEIRSFDFIKIYRHLHFSDYFLKKNLKIITITFLAFTYFRLSRRKLKMNSFTI